MAQYKTIVLELLQSQYPELHDQLRATRTLLATLDRLAAGLRTAHFAWMDELRRANPDRDPARISGEALELAIQLLQGDLPPDSTTGDAGGIFSLDAAMASIRPPTPNA
jgi:hypothetical protein